MIQLPIGLVIRIAELLGNISKMKPGFEIYEEAKQINIDLLKYLKSLVP